MTTQEAVRTKRGPKAKSGLRRIQAFIETKQKENNYKIYYVYQELLDEIDNYQHNDK